MTRILIAGIGNIFLGDDGFGVAVAQRLSQRKQPDGVRVVDFGCHHARRTTWHRVYDRARPERNRE
jgi:hydrogenase maturation protease